MKMKSLTHDKTAEVTGDYEGLTVCDFDGIRAVVDLEATRAWYETAGGWALPEFDGPGAGTETAGLGHGGSGSVGDPGGEAHLRL